MRFQEFNIDNGYLEGLCRGFKNGVLKQADYINLVQCETLDGKFSILKTLLIFYLKFMSVLLLDLKLHLQSTDYGQFLANEPSPLAVSVIDDRLREKLVIEFQHMRNHAVEPLATFLDYIT